MNSWAFNIFFFAVALFGMAQSLGTLTTVAFDGALTIPLLAASAGTGLGTAIAVLGVLKLGAAALLLLSSQAGSAHSARSQRSAENIEEKKDGLFALIRSMDTLECGKNLVCELETKGEEALEQDEALILSLFSDRKFKKQVNPASAKAEYDLAAELGLASRNQVICRQRYASCPYTSEEMMGALRNSHL
jgi:hypothetical protein